MSDRSDVQHVLAQAQARIEVLVCRVRYVAVLLMLGATMFLAPWSRPVALIAVTALLTAGVWLHLRARRGTDAAIATSERAALVVDGVAAAAFYLLFLGDPQGVPIAVVSIYAFELALRRGVRGAVLGGALFLAALLVRVVVQLRVLEDGDVRVPLLLVWAAVLLLLLVAGTELRRRHEAWRAAVEGRSRTAARFRGALDELIRRADIPPESARAAAARSLFEELAEDGSRDADELAADLAALLTDGWSSFGLTTREEEILALLVVGSSDRHMARELFISTSTVRNHVFNIRRKVGADSREQLVEIARTLR
jgi:DNA-binding CsgD family transcriptional regulator